MKMRKNTYRIFFILIMSTVIISSCNDNQDEVDKFSLLNSSNWLGAIEITDTDYDSNDHLIDQKSTNVSDGQYTLFILNNDKTATIKYICDKKSKCEGDVYGGTWELQNNSLQVWINREEINSLSDALLIKGDVFQISNSELTIEITFNNPTPGVAKRIRQIKYISSQEI